MFKPDYRFKGLGRWGKIKLRKKLRLKKKKIEDRAARKKSRKELIAEATADLERARKAGDVPW